MLFNSPEFAVFFPIVTLLYFLLSHRLRLLWLLFASTLFYMAFIPKYVLILFFLILLDYAAGILIDQSNGRVRKFFLIASLIANCGVLGFFKYANFIAQNITDVGQLFGSSLSVPVFHFILPIGLSFHTFQSMSYTIEVYLRRQPVERNLGIYALYVMFYPQLVAGPIERPQNLLHQFREQHRFDAVRVSRGLTQMLWGLFKKVVIADRLAVLVNHVYANPQHFHGWPLIIASYFFAIQIYCDFSGYSDIAIGAARVMGFKLMTNFNRPYSATNLPDFWHRWHISLSTWFRDYVYIPLGGNRDGAWLTRRNLFLVFVISGLWHGASWTYVIWGLIHGSLMVAILATKDLWHRFSRLPWAGFFGWLLTFQIVVAAWVFFRANSLPDAIYVLRNFSTDLNWSSIDSMNLGMTSREFFLSVGLIALLELIQYWIARPEQIQFYNRPVWIRWCCYYGLILGIAWLGKFNMQQFIYFQF